MKPEGWTEMSEIKQMLETYELYHSPRGRLLIGQAIKHEIEKLNQKEQPPISDIEDLEMLYEMYF